MPERMPGRSNVYDSKGVLILSSARHEMRQNRIALLFCSLLALTASLAAQDKPNSSPSGKPSNSSKGPAQDADSDAPLAPSSAEEDVEVASYYVHKGDSDAAIPRLEDAIRLKPKWAKPRLMLAEIYEKKGDAAAAVKCYKDYLQAFPNAPDEKKIEKKIEKLSGQ
jgi:Tfp pilus assembly protein PilF